MTYEEMLAGRGLKVGDQVICQYRIPSAIQWWIHPFWVGVIEAAGTDPADWNGHNSEAQYCVTCKSVKVRYLPSDSMAGFTQHDSLGNLRGLEYGDVDRSPYFGSDDSDYDALRAFSAKAGLMDRYPGTLRVVKTA